MSQEENIKEESRTDLNSTDWRSGLESMQEKWRTSWENKIMHDVTFHVGKRKDILTCHKLVLSIASPVFQAMFSANFQKNSSEPIEIPDIEPNVFEEMLSFLYIGKLDVPVVDAIQILYAAKKYDISDLISACRFICASQMKIVDSVMVYQNAKFLVEVELQRAAWNYIKMNFQELMISDAFFELTHENLCEFLQSNEILIDLEVNLFLAVKRWVKFQCEVKEVEINVKNQLDILGEAINFIRFRLLSPQQFCTEVAPTGLLTSDDCMAILMEMNAPEVDWQMASLNKFSNVRRKQLTIDVLFYDATVNQVENRGITYGRRGRDGQTYQLNTWMSDSISCTHSVLVIGVGLHCANINENYEIICKIESPNGQEPCIFNTDSFKNDKANNLHFMKFSEKFIMHPNNTYIISYMFMKGTPVKPNKTYRDHVIVESYSMTVICTQGYGCLEGLKLQVVD